MKLYFIRHGETDYNKENRLQGGLDTKLNDIGKEQALKASEEIVDLEIDVIISSPQRRAVDTAEIIASKLNKK
ncbi:MAG: histidine phosphatase family protein, partial [Clostridiales bacterium]|nr:histidine phosphatase family protein [Clostridiales bacterium]